MSTKRDTPCRPVMSMLCAALLLTTSRTPTATVQTPNASSYVILGTLAILSFSQVPSKLSGFELTTSLFETSDLSKPSGLSNLPKLSKLSKLSELSESELSKLSKLSKLFDMVKCARIKKQSESLLDHHQSRHSLMGLPTCIAVSTVHRSS